MNTEIFTFCIYYFSIHAYQIIAPICLKRSISALSVLYSMYIMQL